MDTNQPGSRSQTTDSAAHAAHDLRNALSVLRGYTQLITRRRHRAGVGIDPDLERALAAVERATDDARVALETLEMELQDPDIDKSSRLRRDA